MPKQTTENFLYAEAEKLKAEAQGNFKTIVRERKEDSYYLRHALFPKVVRELYDESCAICRLNAQMEQGSRIIDAAHIVPFAHSHNDGPRNGLALCKNHHWGSDTGAFTIAEDYRIILSRKLQNSRGYLTADGGLHLPAASRYHPSPEALRWHRENIFQP